MGRFWTHVVVSFTLRNFNLSSSYFHDFWVFCGFLNAPPVLTLPMLQSKPIYSSSYQAIIKSLKGWSFICISFGKFLIPILSILAQKLSNIKCDSSRFVSASLACNKHKNRLVHILPVEGTRVCLSPIRGIEGSDYINASFIDGYRQRGAYIATQGPLLDTTEDFWRMLWEHNSPIVVMLTKLKEMGRVSVKIYFFILKIDLAVLN